MAKCKSCHSSGMFLKLNEDGICLDCATNRIKELQKRITPVFEQTEDIEALLKTKTLSLQSINADLDRKNEQLASLEAKVKSTQKDLVFLSEQLELESFGLYIPRYDFSSSDEYKEKLESIRDDQKQMIKENTALIFNENFTVNGNKTQGRQMISDMSKLFLRSFNAECDAAVRDVKFSNFDRCKDRMIKAFENINKLGRINSMSISYQYRQSKLDELTLAYEYQCKKQEEKEEIQALRAAQREEAKLAKEIESARKEAEKEKKHYIQAVEKIKLQLQSCNESEKSDLLSKQNDLLSHLDDISARLEDMDYRQSNQKAGYVYIISNIGSFGEGVYKIGMTRRLDPMERIYELGDASVPFMFDVHAMIFSDDAPKLEAALHHAFSDKRVNMINNRREYFRVSLEEIKQVVRENHDKTVEFTEIAEAQQYRETLLLRK